jgi:hypothetical protein
MFQKDRVPVLFYRHVIKWLNESFSKQKIWMQRPF